MAPKAAAAIDMLDGRRQRASASRRRIAVATLELINAGESIPSADQVAERAGVGRRTVFRLFSDMEGVYREMHAVMIERLAPKLATPFAAQGWRERLDEIVERRARMFEEMLPVKSASDAHRYASNFLQEEHKKLTRLQRQTLLAVLPASVAAQTDKIEALDLILSFESWRRLRQEQRLSIKQAIATQKLMVAALMD
ncbi:MAG: TetR/AcrR family transcriptional regulator [Vitreimonas sp.]